MWKVKSGEGEMKRQKAESRRGKAESGKRIADG